MDTDNKTAQASQQPANSQDDVDCVRTTVMTQMTREQRRSRRKRAVRAHTVSVRRLTKRELEIGRALYPETNYWKPKTRGECVDVQRPCPYVSCKYNLYLDVHPRTGSYKHNFPDLEVWEMDAAFSCALDVADRGGVTLEQLGAAMNLTRERVRQLEVKGLAKLSAHQEMESLRDFIDEGPKGKRRLPVLTADDFDDAKEGVPDEDDEESEDALDQCGNINLDDLYA